MRRDVSLNLEGVGVGDLNGGWWKYANHAVMRVVVAKNCGPPETLPKVRTLVRYIGLMT